MSSRESYTIGKSSSEGDVLDDQDQIVDGASDESFPASDPPAWTPVTGVGDHHVYPGRPGDNVRPIRAGATSLPALTARDPKTIAP